MARNYNTFLSFVPVSYCRGLGRVLKAYFRYYHESRTHLGLEKDCPMPRLVEPPELGVVDVEPMVGGLHHRLSPPIIPSRLPRLQLRCLDYGNESDGFFGSDRFHRGGIAAIIMTALE